MQLNNLLAQIALGEDSTCQFKADAKNADSLASEMAAFVNLSSMQGVRSICCILSDSFSPASPVLACGPKCLALLLDAAAADGRRI